MDKAKHDRVVTLHTYNKKGRMVLSSQQARAGNTVFGGGNGLFSTASDYLKFCNCF